MLPIGHEHTDSLLSPRLSGPTSAGSAGISANAAAPALQYQIGQYFKGQDAEGSSAHILAHTILAAATAAAGGNDALTAGLSAGGAELAAPLVANWLFGKDTKDLTADQKQTISNIVGLATAGGTLAAGGSGADMVPSSSLAQTAVEDNNLIWTGNKKITAGDAASEYNKYLYLVRLGVLKIEDVPQSVFDNLAKSMNYEGGVQEDAQWYRNFFERDLNENKDKTFK